MARIDEIAPDLFPISVFAPQFDLQFNHFVVRDDEPLLFHTGTRRMFPEVRDAVAKIIDLDSLRWISWSHFECCDNLTEVGMLTRAIADIARAGRFRTVITDTLLNRLARDGVRMRTYVLEPGDRAPCAVWADDDLIVTRYRAPLSGIDSATEVLRLSDGRELGRLDVPVHPGQQEIIDAISASLLRSLPETTVRVSLTGRSGDAERTLGEYVLEHGGTFDRAVDR